MAETIELRLINLAQKVAKLYENRITPEQSEQLYNAIKVCRDYHVEGKSNWGDMYNVVLGEDAIWEYGECDGFEKEITYMWRIETCILICNCWLGCNAEGDSEPQDMELRGENIPDFIEFLEAHIDEKNGFEMIFEFWNQEMCY